MTSPHGKADSGSHSKAVSGLRSRVSQASLSYDVGTSNENEMMEQVMLSSRLVIIEVLCSTSRSRLHISYVLMNMSYHYCHMIIT